MATQDFAGCAPITLPAAGDLSAGQYRFVNVNTSGQVAVVASAGGRSVGVLQNEPDALNKPATVMTIHGTKTKVVLGGTVTAGDDVQADGNGAAITASTGDHVAGVCVVGGDAGEIGEIILGRSHLNA